MQKKENTIEKTIVSPCFYYLQLAAILQAL